MANGTRKDTNSLPIEESLDKPFPYPLQERGDQRWLVEDLPGWSDFAQHFKAKIQRIGNVPIATLVTYLLAVAMEILKIFTIQKDRTRERNEMKTKVEEIIHTKLKEIEHHKWKLEEQIKNSSESLSMISYNESLKWEMNLITVKELVFRCEAEIACLHRLVGRLESRAHITIYRIIVQYVITGLALIGVLFYWMYMREDFQTAGTVKVVTAVCLLGVARHCIRKAQVLFDSYTLVSECEQVKSELEKPTMACLMYKHAVEYVLPERKKILHEIPKCKND